MIHRRPAHMTSEGINGSTSVVETLVTAPAQGHIVVHSATFANVSTDGTRSIFQGYIQDTVTGDEFGSGARDIVGQGARRSLDLMNVDVHLSPGSDLDLRFISNDNIADGVILSVLYSIVP